MSLTTKSNNTFFHDLGMLMKSPEFLHFYKTHMSSNLDLKTSLVYIELYATIDKLVMDFTGKKIDDKDMEEVLKECFRRKEYRQPLTAILNEYLTSGVSKQHVNQQLCDVFMHSLKNEHLLEDYSKNYR